jgi:hypothetical protein
MTRLPLRRAGAALVAAAALTACSHPEKIVVDKYFQAVNARDKQTLASFALVNLNLPEGQKVEKYVIKGSTTEPSIKAPLPDLLKTQKDVQNAIKSNQNAYNAYFLGHMKEVDDYRDLKKSGGKIPAKLSTVATEWDKFEQTAKELGEKGGGKLAEAKTAVDREKKMMMVSVGNVDNVEGLEGELLTKHLDLDLTIAGQVHPYKMTLKKYDVKQASGKGGKVISRWIVAGLQKQ